MSAAAPYTPPGTMTPTQAADIARRARKLLRNGAITTYDYAVLDALLWSGRKPGADAATISYSRLQTLAHVARGTAVQAIRRLIDHGLLTRLKRRLLTLWHNGGRRWRQLSNQYRFRCESTGRPESEKQEIQILALAASAPEISAAQAALDQRRQLIEARLLGKGRRFRVSAS